MRHQETYVRNQGWMSCECIRIVNANQGFICLISGF